MGLSISEVEGTADASAQSRTEQMCHKRKLLAKFLEISASVRSLCPTLLADPITRPRAEKLLSVHQANAKLLLFVR
jgi:hypothetical protein